ncbi:MAG: hypothetical protein ACRD5Z_02430 [Bryobacteraceae bacterium]
MQVAWRNQHVFTDYRLCVLQDACADADTQVRDLLMSKVSPTQAEVLAVDDFVARLGID